MNKSFFKNSILILFALVGLITVFAPHEAKASFINFQVDAQRLRADGTKGPMKDFKVTMDSTRSSSEGRYWSSGGDCIGCENVKTSVTTGDSGSSSYSSGLACGASDCGNPDTGNCNPFRISGSVPSPGDYDADISHLHTPWGEVNGTSFSVDKSYDNNDNPTWDFVWYGRKDTLSNLTLSSSGTDSKTDCSALAPNVATKNFTANVGHTQKPTSPGHIIQYNFHYGDGHSSGWQTSKTSTHNYSWSDVGFNVNAPDSKVITASVSVHDGGFYSLDAWHPRTLPDVSTTFTIEKEPRKLLCGAVSATPKTGVIPLTVTFNGYIEDTWLCGTVPQYDWNFGDGTSKTNIGQTTVYTYILENLAGFNPAVTGTSAGMTKTCPIAGTIRSQEWSDTNFQEVAP